MTATSYGLLPSARVIPLSLRLALFFGHPVALIGCILFCLGMMFMILFGMSADTNALLYFRDSDPSVPARIVDIKSTNSSESKRYSSTYHYEYTVDGRDLKGTSFSSKSRARVGDVLPARYVPGEPERSRIAGMRSAPNSWGVIPFTMIFPLIGASMLYFAIRRFKTNLHLARYGIVTTGQVGRREATNVTINDQRVYRVYFTFSDNSGKKHESYVDSHHHENLGDEHAESLLYDAKQPEKAVLIDSLPAALRKAVAAAP